METTEKLQRIERIQKKLRDYRDALETLTRLERDPELRLFLGSGDGDQQPKSVRSQSEDDLQPTRTPPLEAPSRSAKPSEEPTDKEKQYYGDTDQETVLRIGHEFLRGVEVQAPDLLALISGIAPVFTAQKKLDEKKVNDHLNKAYNAGEPVGGLMVERAEEGKRGRGGYPATYRILSEKEAAHELFD